MRSFWHGFEKAAMSVWKGRFGDLSDVAKHRLAPLEDAFTNKLRSRAGADIYHFMGGTTGANVHQRANMAQKLMAAAYPGALSRPEIQDVVGQSAKMMHGR